MTTDETLRATLHVFATMQLDVLFVLQSGTMTAADAKRLLEQLYVIQNEVHLLREAAAETPERHAKYAAPGQSAIRPSDN